MDSKKCAKCIKTVYPVEELKCLDKVWHKACFKCQECNMTLNMKNYKGFDKLPYCGAHVPKAKATIVADTPEMKRLASNTKIQSNVQYHAEFEATKSKFTTVTDDPETKRLVANARTISNITYHGLVEQKEEQEKKRSVIDPDEAPTVPQVDRKQSDTGAPQRREEQVQPRQVQQQPIQPPSQPQPPPPQQVQQMPPPSQPVQNSQRQQYRSSFDASSVTQANRHSQSSPQYPQNAQSSSQYYQPQQRHSSTSSGPQYVTQHGQMTPQQQQMYYQQQQQQRLQQERIQQERQLQQERQMQQERMQQERQMQQERMLQEQRQMQQERALQSHYYQQQQMRSMSQSGHQQHGGHHAQQQPRQAQQQQQPMAQMAPVKKTSQPRGDCFQAIYDYEAQDDDEVSFRDGDLIINCVKIDEGWMCGTVHRTGQYGMLPANYVTSVRL